MSVHSSHRLSTLAVHAGERRRYPDLISTSTPIYPSISYHYGDAETLDAVFAGTKEGYVYRRYGNPTVTALEEAVAKLEGGAAALAFASGMGAVHGALLAAGVQADAALVIAQDCYGATYTLADKLLARQGVRVHFVDIGDPAQVESALQELRPAVLYLETISNPLLKVADVPRLTEMAHQVGAKVVVDNTFATPYLLRPLEHGVDFVVHSATKYLGGHGDAMGGVVVTAEAAARDSLLELNKMLGSVLGPLDAWLIHRGLKTLPLRLRQQSDNALAIARWLADHPRVARVHYPGLPDHPQHLLAARLFAGQGFGGMVSFDLRDGRREDVLRFLDRLSLILPATTLGDVYSLALYPAMSSHRALTPEQRARVGIGEGLIRLSIGIEDVNDILADLEQALT